MEPSDATSADRGLFSLPGDVTYLDCAFMGPLPRTAVEAGWVALDRKARPWTMVADDLVVPGELFRARVAGLLGAGADADGVAITPSASFGLSTFAAQLALEPGQVVLVPGAEFPSNLLPWQAVARAAGAIVVRVPPGADGDRSAALVAAVEEWGERVALVAAAPCHWMDGRPFDLEALGAAARRVGAALAVDVCQSLGAVPFEMARVQPDVVVGVTYKWLLGPYSLGFAWFAPRWREGVPLDHGWAARVGAEDATGLAEPSEAYRDGARRYDVGEAAQLLQMPVALAGLQLVEAWDPARTAQHARRLSDVLVAGAAECGVGAPPTAARSPHLVGLDLSPRRCDPVEVKGRLADAQVHVSARGEWLRVSVHRFNDDGDIARFVAALGPALDASS